MSRIVELNKMLTDLNHESEDIQKQTAIAQDQKAKLRSSLADYGREHNIKEIRKSKDSLATTQAKLKALQNEVAEAETRITTIELKISEEKRRITLEEENVKHQLNDAVSKVKTSWPESVSTLTFDIGNGPEHLSIERFRCLAEKVIEIIDNSDKVNHNPNSGKDIYEMGALIKAGALNGLFMPLLNAILFGIYKCVNGEFKNFGFCKTYEEYSKVPNYQNLKKTIDDALQIILGSPVNGHLVRFEWNDKISEILPQLVEIYCPIYHELKQLFFTATQEFEWFDGLKTGVSESEAIKDFFVELGGWCVLCNDSSQSELCSAYTIAAAEFDYEPALKELARDCGYHTVTARYSKETLWPVFNGKADTNYPSISTGLLDGEKPVKRLRMIDFFNQDTSSLNHFISVAFDRNRCNPDIATTVMQSILASMMAWIGPKKFTLDIVDFEYSGVGAYPAQFLPEKTVKFISRLSDWDEELSSLESLIEKRSRKMQSIYQYNSANPDRFEPFKIVVIQDYEGVLVTDEKMPDYPDPREKEHLERQKANVKRFLRFLELGYRYGIIFLVGSKEGVYNPSVPSIILKGGAFFSKPYNILKVEGIDNSDSDFLMKWLADGDSTKDVRDKAQAAERQDGADGILTTEIADDGTDVEFRMDTVSHTHAFVIGKTGSGKSVLLHNIITGLINSYGPDDLELYLLDLKMGGVEFNRYRRLPHLRSLLVDNSDIQIVLEIMRDIELMMRERGKVFRNAGVSNVKEYNRANPDKKMAQVIVVIDECHAIFSMGSGRGAAKEQREITERLIKIAKEGRSQGIHLIFATQTLSGSEIPSDIQKNITDYYLLKCAPSDSESLVRGSSTKTEALPVGKVYYYHADRQALFQGVYNDNQACAELIDEALRRYSGMKSHGQFYFNGAQTFELDNEVISKLTTDTGRTVAGSPGRLINLQQTPVVIKLRKDYGDNILITGINSDEQLSRTTIALMSSQIAAAKAAGKRLKVNVINCLDAESQSSVVLSEMSDAGLISLFRPRESESLLKQLCDGIAQNTLDCDTLLYIIGQERYGELKRDQRFTSKSPDENTGMGMIDIFQGVNMPSKPYDSFKKAIVYLLENGPTAGLYTVIQVDKLDKLLFEESIYTKVVNSRFKHIIILRSDMRTATTLGLSDDINVDTLSADPERLRAYYYCDDDGTTKLFSPYEIMNTEILLNL